MEFITLSRENLSTEHLCCAIADKKHQAGVNDKRRWLAERIAEGHIFRKLDAKGKVLIDTLEKAKQVPCVFNNWAVFYKGKFETVHLLNEGLLRKMLQSK